MKCFFLQNIYLRFSFSKVSPYPFLVPCPREPWRLCRTCWRWQWLWFLAGSLSFCRKIPENSRMVDLVLKAVFRIEIFTLKNDWLRSPPISFVIMLFWIIGFPPSRRAMPNSTASTNMLGEWTLFMTSSTTRSDAPSRSRWLWTSCRVRPARLNNFAVRNGDSTVLDFYSDN